MIKLKNIDTIISRFESKTILVFGDIILDRYIFGHVERISPEAPVPVVKVEREEYRAGGAANVAANIDKLGAVGLLCGVTGDDPASPLFDSLKPQGNLILRAPGQVTLVKTRVISQRQQIVRIDREEPVLITPELEARIRDQIDGVRPDGIIVSDYAKGTLTAGVMEILLKKARELDIPIIVDPKPPNYHLYKHVDGITPNQKEAEAVYNRKIPDDTVAAGAVRLIMNRFKTRFAVITRGANGISACERGKQTFHLPAFSHEVYDVTGAGDTVVAVLTLALVCGSGLREAVAMANAAASLVIEKVGATQVNSRELHSRLKLLRQSKNNK